MSKSAVLLTALLALSGADASETRTARIVSMQLDREQADLVRRFVERMRPRDRAGVDGKADSPTGSSTYVGAGRLMLPAEPWFVQFAWV